MEVNEYSENYGTGWIMLYRSIKKHWVFENDKFFKWWVIMLLEVNHTNRKMTLGYEIYEIKKGESSNSLRTWANLFNTSTKSVSKFFKLLEKDDMISIKIIGKGKQSTTLVNVICYAKYQGGKETLTTTQATTQGKRNRDTNNNVNNYNNVEEGGIEQKIVSAYDCFIQEIKDHKHDMAIERIYMRLKVKKGTLQKILEDYKGQIIIDQKLHKTTREMLSHFSNYCNTQDRIGKLDEHKTTKLKGAL